MKIKTLCMGILLGLLSAHSFAQRSWTPWIELWSYQGQSAFISFNKISNCNNFSYSFFKTDNNIVFDHSFLQFSFNYYDCDGQLKRQSGSIDLGRSGVDDNQGQWFLTNGGRIFDIKTEEVYIPSKKLWLKRENDQTIDYWKKRYGND